MSQLALFSKSLRWGMSIPKALLALAVFSLAYVHAQTVLVDEDWQDPLFENNKSRNTGDFTGWSFNNQWVYSNRDDRTNSVPGDSGFDTNQILNLVYTSAYLDYDISHSWAEGDVYYLRIEASPNSWNGHRQRYIRPELLQQDGTVLWATEEGPSTSVPLYDNFGVLDDYSPELTFFFKIDASDFDATEGAPLRLRIRSSGQRGLYVNNVTLTLGPLPEDNTAPEAQLIQWEVSPQINDFIKTSMTACSVQDPGGFYGVEYFFENLVAETDSGWQQGRTWDESDLAYDTEYLYRFKVRDKSPNLNESEWSSTVTVTTLPRDSSPPTPDPLNWQTLPEVGDYGAITMSVEPASDQGGVGVQYFFENTVTNTNSGWQFENVWTEDGLSHDTLHTFRVKARDTSPDLNESTQWTTAESVRTPAIPSGMLLITGFQSPLFSNGQSNPDFAGWALTNGGSVKTRLQGGDGVPGDSTADGSNQAIQFAYTNAEIHYAISHEWSASDTYILSLNAAPQKWNNSGQRYVRPRILQQDGTVLWDPGENLSGPERTALPIDVSFGNSDWQDEPDLNFTFTIDASTFTSGTEGQPIALRLGSSGQRGLYVDNVAFSLEDPEELDHAVTIKDFTKTFGFEATELENGTNRIVTGSFAGYLGQRYTVQWAPELSADFVPLPGNTWPIEGSGALDSEGEPIQWSFELDRSSAFFRLLIE